MISVVAITIVSTTAKQSFTATVAVIASFTLVGIATFTIASTFAITHKDYYYY